jgi:2-methylcitrate dehydratase PrpD
MTDAPTIAEALGAFAADDRPLPGDVEASVRQRILDILGIAVAATQLDTSVAVMGYAASQGGTDQATAVGLPAKLPSALAALVNGTLAHSLDYDDTHLPSVLHPSAAVVPAALAAAEAHDADAPTLSRAVAVGLEICVRTGMAGYDPELGNSVFFERGQHATSICGAIGGAAAAAVAMGLDAGQITSAMGVAASMASGIIEANRTGGTVKRLHCGWAAHSAVTAAELVARGITGPPTVFEGRFGFYQAFLSGQADLGQIVDDLGDTWSVPGIFFKPYPANHFTHAGIDAALDLRRGGLRPDDVVEARLGVAPAPLRTIGEPLAVKQAPDTGYQAQFSGPYTVAAALFGGGGLGLGLRDFTDELARDPKRRELMGKITVVPDERCEAIFPTQFPAVLTVRTTSGDELVREVFVNRGGPQNPLSDDELGEKLRDNVDGLLDDDDRTALVAGCTSLGTEPSTTVGEVLAPVRRPLGFSGRP